MLVSAGADVVARVIVVMSSEQAAAKSTAKDAPKSDKKLSLRRTMLILDIKPEHYKAYFAEAWAAWGSNPAP